MRLNALAVLFILLVICSAVSDSIACTSFCFNTPDGPVYGTNLDLATGDGHLFVNRSGIAKEGYREGTTGETAKWISRFGSVTFNLVGRELPWGGINEAGLTMSSMQLNASRCPDLDERPPFSEASIVQYILDTCSNVQEAIQAASVVRLAQNECRTHYLLADESGDCAAFEFLNGEFVYYHGETLPVKALANSTYASCLAYIEKDAVPADNPGASVERVAGAAYMADKFDPSGEVSPVDYSFRILTETVIAPKKWWSNWFNEPYTRWNVVFDITKRTIHYRTVESPEVKRLSLDSFDFSCEAPFLMMDVNIELEGSVDHSFQPYDHDANLKVFRSFCDDWGIDVSKEDAIKLIELFESYECAP